MSFFMTVYVNNENDAESLAVSLEKYNITDVNIEKIPSSNGEEDEMQIAPSGTIGDTSTPETQGRLGLFPSLEKLKETLKGEEKIYPDYQLNFYAPDENKEEILEEIKQTDSYIDKKSID